MKLGLMQPYFMPYIGYWQRIYAVDEHVIYDDVNYIKGGWMNRNKILLGGEARYLSMNLAGASPNKLINEVEVNTNPILQTKMVRTLEQGYKKAKYFDAAMECLEPILRSQETNLAKYLAFQIKRICEYMNIRTKLIISSDIEKNNSLKGQDKVIEICKKQGADTYYNAHTGMELYSKTDFEKENIRLVFMKDRGTVRYGQLNKEYIPSLSIIDILMNCSKDKIEELLNDYMLM